MCNWLWLRSKPPQVPWMVRSIGPIGKKAARIAPACRQKRPGPALLRPPWRRSISRRNGALQPPRPPWTKPWRLPWFCWCRRSLPCLLAVAAGSGCRGTQRGVGGPCGAFAGARLYRSRLTKALRITHTPVCRWATRRRPPQARLWSSPWRKMSCGKSMPMNTILLRRSSSSPHLGPRSLPMSWCTPWKITLRSVPFMFSTPL